MNLMNLDSKVLILVIFQKKTNFQPKQNICADTGWGRRRGTRTSPALEDSRANWPTLTKFNPEATNKTSQKAKRRLGVGWGRVGGLTLVNWLCCLPRPAKSGSSVAAPSLYQKSRLFGTEKLFFFKYYDNHNF